MNVCLYIYVSVDKRDSAAGFDAVIIEGTTSEERESPKKMEKMTYYYQSVC